jgi:hypothetical protein
MAIRKIREYTDEQVDAHLQAVGAVDANGKVIRLNAKARKNLADVYKAARPIMIQALGILRFVKKNWATVLEGLIASLDDAMPSAVS